MIRNERAARREPGRGDCAEMGITASCRKNSAAATADRVISDPAQRWLDRVEITAQPGIAGFTDRRVAAAIVQSLKPGRDAFATTHAQLGQRAGVGIAGTTAALRRLADRGLIFVDSQPGRGLGTWISPRLGRW